MTNQQQGEDGRRARRLCCNREHGGMRHQSLILCTFVVVFCLMQHSDYGFFTCGHTGSPPPYLSRADIFFFRYILRATLFPVVLSRTEHTWEVRPL